MIETQLLTYDKWTFRLQTADGKPGRLLILLHGWMGDENSMWVLAQKLSRKYTILAPRGPFPVSEGGYSWREIRQGPRGTPTIEDFSPAVAGLLSFIDNWAASNGSDAGQFDLMGFSQGAAMVYSVALYHPERIRKMAALSGFIPVNGEAFLTARGVSGKAIFVTHGRMDETISVEEARKSVRKLKEAGAQVSYCESDAEHRVSKECLRAMEVFLREP